MSYRLGTIYGVKITARPSAIIASIALWAIATEVATPSSMRRSPLASSRG